MRRSLTRFVLFPVLLIYSLSLIFASWRTEIRPSLIDPLWETVVRWQGRLGIPSGMAVFTTTNPSMVMKSQCIEVIAFEEGEPVRTIYPPEPTACPQTGFLPRNAPSRVLLIRLVRDLIFLHNHTVQTDNPVLHTGYHRVQQILGRFFTHMEAQQGRTLSEFRLRWKVHLLDENGVEREVTRLLMRFRQGSPPRIDLQWRPTPAQLHQWWPARSP